MAQIKLGYGLPDFTVLLWFTNHIQLQVGTVNYVEIFLLYEAVCMYVYIQMLGFSVCAMDLAWPGTEYNCLLDLAVVTA